MCVVVAGFVWLFLVYLFGCSPINRPIQITAGTKQTRAFTAATSDKQKQHAANKGGKKQQQGESQVVVSFLCRACSLALQIGQATHTNTRNNQQPKKKKKNRKVGEKTALPPLPQNFRQFSPQIDHGHKRENTIVCSVVCRGDLKSSQIIWIWTKPFSATCSLAELD